MDAQEVFQAVKYGLVPERVDTILNMLIGVTVMLIVFALYVVYQQWQTYKLQVELRRVHQIVLHLSKHFPTKPTA